MNAEQLIEKYNGCVAVGRGIVRINNENIVVARRVDGTLVLTEEGRKLASSTEVDKPAEAPKAKRTRKPKADVGLTPAEAPTDEE